MATKTPTKKPATRNTRQDSPTFERAKLLSPTESGAEKIARTFALDPVDYAGIRDATEEHMVKLGQVLPINETALKIHVQRLTGAHVAGAVRAGEFYSQRCTDARNLTSSLANDARDEDRDAPIGFDSRAARARQFAAEAGMQAHALLAAAEGALAAYAFLIGEDWKPYEGTNAPVSREAAAAELDAFS